MGVKHIGIGGAAFVALLAALAEMDRAAHIHRDENSLGTFHIYWGREFPYLPLAGLANSLTRFGSRDVAPRYYDMDWYFPGHKVLEAHAPEIRKEALRLLYHRDNLLPYHKLRGDGYDATIDPESKWRTFVLKWYGEWQPQNIRLAPKTYAALKNMTGGKNISGWPLQPFGDGIVKSVMFSILMPGQGIPPHQGVSCSALRYHLGLVVPEGDCWITVDGVNHRWEEGKGMLFDDTYMHSVTNNATGPRIVLFMDVWKRLDWKYRWMERFFESLGDHLASEQFKMYARPVDIRIPECCGKECDEIKTWCPEDAPNFETPTKVL